VKISEPTFPIEFGFKKTNSSDRMRRSFLRRAQSEDPRTLCRAKPQLAVRHLVQPSENVSIPMLGFGTYRLAPTDVDAALRCAVEHGFRHIDCAKIYGNQKEIGVALADVMRAPPKGIQHIARDDLWLTSKLWPTDQHPDNVEKACRETLKELRTEYLDLYLIHWPVCWEHTGNFETDDDKMPKDASGLARVNESVKLTDTWRAMCQLVKKGLVRNIGLSNCSEKHLEELVKLMDVDPDFVSPITNQIEVHLALKQTQLRHRMSALYGVTTSSYCPLGMPTRFTPEDFKGIMHLEVFKKLSELAGISPAALLLSWNVDEGNITIVKAMNRNHIIDNSRVARFGMSDPLRLILSSLQLKETRVINPKDFTRSGKSFFEE
jgi:diketogulonate reductase-like aldo/keto reductase